MAKAAKETDIDGGGYVQMMPYIGSQRPWCFSKHSFILPNAQPGQGNNSRKSGV
jgi:hypothetical protein